MKKRGEFDFEAECNFSDLSPDLAPEEIETACKYEYMRESQALRDLHDQDNPLNNPAGRARPSFAEDFGWDATLRLVAALRNAGFPNPWKALGKRAQDELIQAIAGWDDERKTIYPPVAIEPALERDLEREQEQGARFPVLRMKSFEAELRRLQSSRRKCFCGLIRIDEAYNESEAVKAFRNEFRKRWPKTTGGGGTNWRAKLNQLSVMRIWKRERDQWKRLKLVAKFCGYKGCVEELAAHKERSKQGHANEPMSEAAKVEVSGARARRVITFKAYSKAKNR